MAEKASIFHVSFYKEAFDLKVKELFPSSFFDFIKYI